MASGSDISRSSVPVVRSRSIAIEVTRNIVTNGKIPTSGGADAVEGLRLPVEHVLEQRQRARGGTTSTSASVRRSRRSCRRTRAAVASVTRGAHERLREREERLLQIVGAGRAPERVRRAVATMRPSRIRSSSSQRSASSMTWLETRSVVPRAASAWNVRPEVAAQHRIEPDGRLVEDQHARAGRAARSPARRASARRPRACGRPGRRARRARPSRSPRRRGRPDASRIRAK